PERTCHCIGNNIHDLDRLRSGDTQEFCTAEEPTVEALFRAFTVATRGEHRRGFRESTVATAKTLHLLSPGFFPLWDNPIASQYGYLLMWSKDYVSFCWQMKEF